MKAHGPRSPVPAAFREIFERSHKELDRRVSTLEEAARAILDEGLGEELRAAAERDAHKLAGSLGMFGLPRGSEIASELEQALGADATAAAEAPRFAELVLALRRQFDAASEDRGEPGAVENGKPARSGGPNLLLVSADPEITDRLSTEAAGRDFRARTAATITAAARLANEEEPDAVVLEIDFGGAECPGLDLLEDLAGREPPIPVLVLTSSEALVDRVEVARRGGRGFLGRVHPASQVIDAVGEQIERDPTEVKVLAVDDDPAILEALKTLLAPRGLEVTTLSEPLDFWSALETTAPDLLILDHDMPDLDGVDLCRAVRADVRFGQLPIVFLTLNTSPVRVQKIFEAGADDYVSKPIVGPELIRRVLNRLERIRLYRDLAETDSLTGIASRRRSTAAIEDLLALAKRFEQPFSLAVIDLDHFKRLNDTLGHASGDAALRRFGEVLSRTFRGEDVIGRWGGEEFVVGGYGMAREVGVKRVGRMLEHFRDETFSGRDGRTTKITFSAGVAEYPSDGDNLHDLYRAADDALYEAKASGRNRVLPAGSQACGDEPGPNLSEKLESNRGSARDPNPNLSLTAQGI